MCVCVCAKLDSEKVDHRMFGLFCGGKRDRATPPPGIYIVGTLALQFLAGLFTHSKGVGFEIFSLYLDTRVASFVIPETMIIYMLEKKSSSLKFGKTGNCAGKVIPLKNAQGNSSIVAASARSLSLHTSLISRKEE